MQEAVASALTSVLASSVYRKHALAAAAPLAACLAHAAPLFHESLNPAESLCKEPGGVGGGRVGEGGEGGVARSGRDAAGRVVATCASALAVLCEEGRAVPFLLLPALSL